MPMTENLSPTTSRQSHYKIDVSPWSMRTDIDFFFFLCFFLGQVCVVMYMGSVIL